MIERIGEENRSDWSSS